MNTENPPLGKKSENQAPQESCFSFFLSPVARTAFLVVHISVLAVWEISLSNFSALPFSSYYWHFRIEAMENCTVKVHKNCLSKSSSKVQSLLPRLLQSSRNRDSPHSSIKAGLKEPQSPLMDVNLACSSKSLVEEIP